jgi:hypothetical protein
MLSLRLAFSGTGGNRSSMIPLLEAVLETRSSR